MLELIGILGGLLAIAGSIPYILDAFKKKITPHRITWGIFTLVDIIAIANQFAAGATNSIWLVVGFALANLTIFVLSLRHGVGGTKRLDIVVLCGAILGVIAWQISGHPIASIVANLIVITLAMAPTYKKGWTDPLSETSTVFLLGAIASLLAAISVGRLDYILLLTPVYTFVIQGALFIVLVRYKLFHPRAIMK
jgi:hypothetical protein